jgi:hypothetical protein
MDLASGLNSAWQQGPPIGPSCNWSRIVALVSGAVTVCDNTKLIRQYTKYVRPGSQRIAASSRDGVFLPLAFVRPDGGYVVVVQVEDTSRSFSVGGLPAGTYALSYATNSAWNVQLPDATISGGQAITASLAGPGVLTISRK